MDEKEHATVERQFVQIKDKSDAFLTLAPRLAQ